MDKEEIKSFINDAFSSELENRNRVLNAWYRPRGAPGRLSEELLEVWHKNNKTGLTHPSDVLGYAVKIVYDEGRVQTQKVFIRRSDALDFRNKMLSAGLAAVSINPHTGEEDGD